MTSGRMVLVWVVLLVMAVPVAGAHYKYYVNAGVALPLSGKELQYPYDGLRFYIMPESIWDSTRAGGWRMATVNCGGGSDPVLDIGQNAICFGTRNVGLGKNFPTLSDCVPAYSGPTDPTGECTLTLVDDTFSPIYGIYCQDLNDDAFCGGSPFDPPGIYSEPRVEFCDSVTINEPADLTPRRIGQWVGGPSEPGADTWSRNNWNSLEPIVVFLGRLTDGFPGNPGLCGQVVHQGIHGFGTHA